MQESKDANAAAQQAGIRRICVYCGSGLGRNPAYAAAARELGSAMARAGIGLVYGGGGRGLMGETARAVLAEGGKVTGIIPEFLTQKEQMLREVDELIVTTDMHERKKLMYERSDAFVALPGGIGTLEELVEQLTWLQLGQHSKPVVLVSVDGFWEPLRALFGHMRAEAFIRQDMEIRYSLVNTAAEVLPTIFAQAVKQPMREPLPDLVKKF
jgi:uncharacterized protein (TIGR00730 family)